MKDIGTKKQPYLTVIIPAYNEEAVINDTLVDIYEFLLKQKYSSEIIVVNDGSTDKTAEIVKAKMQVMDNLRLVENDKNRGKGYTVAHGAKEAQGKFVLFTDADNATKIDEINRFFPYFKQGYHIVIGSRSVDESNIKVKQSLLRRTLGKGGNLLIQTLVLPGIKDTQCGFKCFTNEAAKATFPKQVLSGWVFDMETLAIGRQLGFKIKEVGITWTDVSKTKMSFLKVYLKSVLDLLKVRWNLTTGKYRK
ncbi:dolichyl-phosphate beta-glucosyltransferase [Patescibacteria group bacterium]